MGTTSLIAAQLERPASRPRRGTSTVTRVCAQIVVGTGGWGRGGGAHGPTRTILARGRLVAAPGGAHVVGVDVAVDDGRASDAPSSEHRRFHVPLDAVEMSASTYGRPMTCLAATELGRHDAARTSEMRCGPRRLRDDAPAAARRRESPREGLAPTATSGRHLDALE